MKKATAEDMELGNLVFGNSRGEYCVRPREDYEEIFIQFLEDNGFDSYGHSDKGHVFENDTFIIRPYYWGDDEEEAEKPNFVYKPTGLEIQWYKYPMRDAYSNQNISIKTFKDILTECANSMEE